MCALRALSFPPISTILHVTPSLVNNAATDSSPLVLIYVVACVIHPTIVALAHHPVNWAVSTLTVERFADKPVFHALNPALGAVSTVDNAICHAVLLVTGFPAISAVDVLFRVDIDVLRSAERSARTVGSVERAALQM